MPIAVWFSSPLKVADEVNTGASLTSLILITIICVSAVVTPSDAETITL